LGTTLTGLVLHGQTPHGDAVLAVSSSGGAIATEVAHVIFATGLTVAIVWHLVDKRRPLLAFVRRRSGKNLRSLLVYATFVGFLVAAIVTGFGDNVAGHVEHHTAISIVLAVALGWHGVRRMAARRRRASRRVPMEVRP
jgi:hypothetical protein